MWRTQHYHSEKSYGGRFEPTGICVHAMAEWLEEGEEDIHAFDFLERRGWSAHALVTPSGVVMETVPITHAAWHARGFNQTHLGVELLVPGIHTWGSFTQKIKEPSWYFGPAFDSLVEVVAGWQLEFSIPLPMVQQHSELSPGRKVDPGSGFPWPSFLNRLREREREYLEARDEVEREQGELG